MAYEKFSVGSGTSGSEVQNPELGNEFGALDHSFSFDGTGDTDGSGGGGSSGDNSGGDGFDPAIHVGRDKLNADGSFRKKRGRKSGGNSAPRATRTKADIAASVDGLSRILVILHAGVSKMTKTPELELEEDDAEMLAKSAAQVLKEFDIQPDPKIEAVIGLVTACGMVYGPKLYMIKQRRKLEKDD